MTENPSGNGRLLARIDERTGLMLKNQDEINNRLKSLSLTQIEHDQRITKVESKVNGFAVLHLGVSALLATIAGWIGSQK